MDCTEVRLMLSAYHDAELSTDQQIAVEVHLESCAECAARLAEIQRLSQAASRLPEPQPPRSLLKKIEGMVVSRTDAPATGWPDKWRRHRPILLATAAIVLVTTALGIYFGQHDHSRHDYLADYWQKFESDPRSAQRQLLVQYSGQVVSDDEALQLVGYRPLTSSKMARNVAVENTYLLDMPCCKCIQTVCRRADGTALAVFEHDEAQPGWFHGRPHVQMQFGGTSCRVTELDRHLAASWPIGQRTVTIVGLRDADELNQWVQALTGTKPFTPGNKQAGKTLSQSSHAKTFVWLHDKPVFEI